MLISLQVSWIESCFQKVGLSREGTLHLLSTDTACRHSVNLGETTLVPLASHDLLPTVPGIELLVATKDGVLMCLMQGNATHLDESGSDVGDEDALYVAWPSETKSHNDFTFLSDQVNRVCCYIIFLWSHRWFGLFGWKLSCVIWGIKYWRARLFLFAPTSKLHCYFTDRCLVWSQWDEWCTRIHKNDISCNHHSCRWHVFFSIPVWGTVSLMPLFLSGSWFMISITVVIIKMQFYFLT